MMGRLPSRWWSVLVAVMLGASTQAQVPPVLTREAFVRIVLENHPMARQAALRPELGAASVRSARGGFDPKATANYDEKTFDEKNYFQLFDAGLKVPTWYGVELFAAFQENAGQFLDPQASTPDDGLLKVGGSISLGQGLFIDQRRAALRRAQAYQRATEAEQVQLLNDLLLQALNDHTDWVAAYRALQVSDTAVALASIRLEAVRGSWRGGDRPAIDTLEAYIQLQDRQMRQQQAALNFRNAGLRLSNHLWDAAQRPLELAPGTLPDGSDLFSPPAPALNEATIDSALVQHPLLAQATARIEQLEVDRRLRSEMLKPELDLKYQWLGDGGALNNEPGVGLLQQGHQFGVGFQVPLFLRRERGELTIARLRLTDADLGLERDRLRIRNRIRERVNDIAVFGDQVQLGANMVVNNERLLAGENQRFNAGESSLFLVNAREVPLIDARIRQVDLEARLRKSYFSLDHEAGILWQAWRP
ncbi:MAG: TolC family protein [Flavobacteriales bacterium]|nr:TolC family protein [Flavobacteriales bacterium]